MKVVVIPNEQHLRRLRELPSRMDPTAPSGIPMSDPALLRALGRVHREQVTANFATEGGTGARGLWPSLSAKYAARKLKLVGRKKILEVTGDTRRRFIRFGHPDYIERFVPSGRAGGTFLFGARSDVAAAHVAGNPGLVSTRSSLPKLFGGRAARLPVRDMITKTAANVKQLQAAFSKWWIESLRQRFRAGTALGLFR